MAVDIATHRPFGHIIGINPIGDVYVVPLSETIRQIKDVFGTQDINILSGHPNPRGSGINEATLPEEVSNHEQHNHVGNGEGLKMRTGQPQLLAISGKSGQPQYQHLRRAVPVGIYLGQVRDSSGPIQFWQASSHFEEVWGTLGPRITRHLESLEDLSNPPVENLLVQMVMVGRNASAARPTVIFFSRDAEARKAAKLAVQKSNILNDYPGIGLGDMAANGFLPADIQQLATDSIGMELATTSSQSQAGPVTSKSVFTVPSDHAFGRRIFIAAGSAGLLRPATGGPILWINREPLQLTVAHAFMDSPVSPPAQVHGSYNAEWSIDGFGENEASYASGEADFKLPETTAKEFAQPMFHRNLQHLGKLDIASDMISEELDYALIQLEPDDGRGRRNQNYILRGVGINQRALEVNGISDVMSGRRPVVALTASSGQLVGEITSNFAFIRVPGHHTFRQVYPVNLHGRVAQGDCGAPVLDAVTQRLYGYIVSGTVGSGSAYVMPLTPIVEDITRRLGDISLVPELRPTHLTKVETRVARRRIVRWSLKRMNNRRSLLNLLRGLEIRHEAFRRLVGRLRRLRQLLDRFCQEERPRLIYVRERVLPYYSEFGSRQFLKDLDLSPPKRLRKRDLLARCLRIFPTRPTGGLDNQTRFRSSLGHNQERVLNAADATSQQFFSLPVETIVHILSYLSIPDILTLRLASRGMNNIIVAHENLIANSYLGRRRLPSLVTTLYPGPGARHMTLGYIAGLRHRYRVSSGLAERTASWIASEIFQSSLIPERNKASVTPLKSLIRRRITPLLFVVFHFLEFYRESTLELLSSPASAHAMATAAATNAPERKIMRVYPDALLLQVHQFFPIFQAFISRQFRAPSYYGVVERFAKGARRAPPELLEVALVCVGGPREILRLVSRKTLEARQLGLEQWYTAISSSKMTGENGRGNQPMIAGPSSIGYSETVPGPSRRAGKEADKPVQRAQGEGLIGGVPMRPLTQSKSNLLLRNLPEKSQIWLPEAERTLLERVVVGRAQDIKKGSDALVELISRRFSEIDNLWEPDSSI